MNNLFIMHTQYNLILATGLMHKNINDRNSLVLYAEFTLSDEMHESLKQVFDDVLVVNDRFRLQGSFFDEIKHIRKCLKKTKNIWKVPYDKIYLSQERTFDLALLGRIRKNKKGIECLAIEEDAYYSIDNRRNVENYVQTVSTREKFKNCLRRIALIGFPYNHREHIFFYGMSEVYDCINLLFPIYARKELSGRQLREITVEELTEGIKKIYSSQSISYPESTKYLVIFMDLLSRYNEKERIKQILSEIQLRCLKEGRTVLVKYHPRETERLETTGEIHEIEMIIPAEKVLLDLCGQDVIVLGNATTACRVAAKLGYKVYSLCKLDAPENEKMHSFMSKLGIQCITTSQEFMN